MLDNATSHIVHACLVWPLASLNHTTHVLRHVPLEVKLKFAKCHVSISEFSIDLEVSCHVIELLGRLSGGWLLGTRATLAHIHEVCCRATLLLTCKVGPKWVHLARLHGVRYVWARVSLVSRVNEHTYVQVALCRVFPGSLFVNSKPACFKCFRYLLCSTFCETVHCRYASLLRWFLTWKLYFCDLNIKF